MNDRVYPKDGTWEAYQEWETALTPEQQEHLRATCRWEQMSRWAVALEFGVLKGPRDE